MGPIDYSLNIANPLQMALQGYQVGQQMQQQRLQQQAAEREREQAQIFAQDMSGLANPNATSADFARVAARHPMQFKQLSEFWGGMDEVKRGFMFDTGVAALKVLNPGADGTVDPAMAAGVFEERAMAAENSGDKATAKELRDAAKVIRANPAGAGGVIKTTLYGADSEKAKTVIDGLAAGGPAYDTPFLKELIAEGKKPGTQEWNDALAKKREGDPWVVVPGVGLYLKKDIAGAAENGEVRANIPEAATKLLRANPNLAPQFDAKYGPGASTRILGGPSQPATGGFQAGPGR